MAVLKGRTKCNSSVMALCVAGVTQMSLHLMTMLETIRLCVVFVAP